MKRVVLLIAIVLTVVVGVQRCAETADRPEVVVYVSADDHVARLVMATFLEETGITARTVGDHEGNKTTGLVRRLRNERDRPRADVFWSSEIFQTIALAEEDVLAPHRSPAATNWPEAFKDPDGRWFGFAGRARVIAYTPDRVEADELPKTWQDLGEARFRGRVVMADPRFGTTGGHLGAMKAYWDREPGDDVFTSAFLRPLAANRVRRLSSGNAGVVRAIISGEADLGMTDTDDVWAAQANGHDIKLVYPRHDLLRQGGGTLVIPNTVARVANGPNPVSAARFIDFMLSETVERLLAESVSHNVPLGPGRADAFPEFAVPDPLRVDFATAAALRESAVAATMETLSGEAPQSVSDDAP